MRDLFIKWKQATMNLIYFTFLYNKTDIMGNITRTKNANDNRVVYTNKNH